MSEMINYLKTFEEYDGEGKGEDEVIEEAMIPWGDSMLLDDDNEGGEHE
jgi:hypothetical protein